MAVIAKKYTDELDNLKDFVEMSYQYFEENYNRFYEFRKFIFQSSLSSDDISLLKTLDKPQIEFNILESYISRLRGEFSKQEPSIMVSKYDDATNVDPKLISFIEDHMRHMFYDANSEGAAGEIYLNQLSGGFAVAKVWTEYASETSFNQVIKFGPVFDPVLCGFDPMAKKSHKGDGRFCFEIFPKSKEEFEEEYPDADITNIKFVRNIEGFNWAYKNEQESIILICDFYQKKNKKKKVVKTADGRTMTMDAYQDMIDNWNDIAQPPTIKSQRWTEIQTICRYRFVEDQILEYTETDYKYLPLVFFDGNSITIRESGKGAVKQLTRPYVYHAMGAQKLKNFAGQTLANELENMLQSPFMMQKENIPKEQEYQEAWTNPQKSSILVYNGFKDNNPDVPLPPPGQVSRIPIPPEITSTFSLCDQVTQSVLGSYDASLGINDNQLSGIAIVEGATQSNAAGMPYVMGHMSGMNQIAKIQLDLIPKYYNTPRTMPIMTKDGKRSYVFINGDQPGSIKTDYDENSLQIKVEAGVNFNIQKSRALNQIIALMQASPIFAQFMNQQGLPVLLDNIDIRGIDQLKDMTTQFTQQMQMQQQQAMQMQQQAQQNNPAMMKVQLDKQKLIQQGQDAQAKTQLHVQQLEIDKQNVINDRLRLMADLKQAESDNAVQMAKTNTERMSKTVDLMLKHTDQMHRHAKESMDMVQPQQ